MDACLNLPLSWAAYQSMTRDALDRSDTMMLRISEFIILGLNDQKAPDVVTFVEYRRALRAIVRSQRGTSGELPVRPAYPGGS